MAVPFTIDITGQKFGRLTAIEYVGKSRWRFSCDCGGETVTYSDNVKKGHTRSCGCYMRERAGESRRKHGKSLTKAYTAWLRMRRRCYDPKCERFPNYGGRGIVVADIWQGEHGFKNFYAHIGDPPSPKHTLDRINTNGHYEPGNVRWSTQKVQQNNRRNNRLLTCFGRSMTLAQWSDDTGIRIATIDMRLRQGWHLEKALVLPAKVWDHELGRYIIPSVQPALKSEKLRPRLDLTGKRYGMLTAIEYAGRSRWRFKCDCGRETIVSTACVRSGNTKSCGCLRRKAVAA